MFEAEPQKRHRTNGAGRLFRRIVQRVRFHDEEPYFLESLSLLLSSGMDVLSALRAAREGARSPSVREALVEILASVESGVPLWQALQKSGFVSSRVVSLLKIGEESGRLAKNIQVVAMQQAKDRTFQSRIQSAMMYPVMVFTLTLVIGIGIAWLVLPRLARVFDELDVELPSLTRGLIWVGRTLGDYGFIIIPALALIGVVVLYLLFFREQTKAWGQHLLFLVPGIRRLLIEVELARVGYVFGTLLSAGVPIHLAIHSLKDATTLVRYRHFYASLAEWIERGETFAFCFDRFAGANRLIPSHIQQMVMAAESSGRLADTFLEIGQAFETRTETTMKNVSVILEPILLVVVWLGVVTVALAVILPIYSLIGGFQMEQQIGT